MWQAILEIAKSLIRTIEFYFPSGISLKIQKPFLTLALLSPYQYYYYKYL